MGTHSIHMTRLLALLILPQLIYASRICPNNEIKCEDSHICCPDLFGGYACCPDAFGVCCPDGLHCCPQGTSCNIMNHTCSYNSNIPISEVRSGQITTNISDALTTPGNVSQNDVIPDWFYGVQYCIHWLDPYPTKQFRVKQCAEIFQQTPAWAVCDGSYTDHDCYRSIQIELIGGAGAPAWWQSVQALSNSPEWSTRFILKVPNFAPAWLLKVKICFYRFGVPFCAPANQWTFEIGYVNHMIGNFGFLPE